MAYDANVLHRAVERLEAQRRARTDRAERLPTVFTAARTSALGMRVTSTLHG